MHGQQQLFTLPLVRHPIGQARGLGVEPGVFGCYGKKRSFRRALVTNSHGQASPDGIRDLFLYLRTGAGDPRGHQRRAQ